MEALKKVELRNAWKHEALDFTNWLAEEENLRLLSDEIGIDIKLIQTEATVGRFNVDILAEEETTDNKIIIENQLETTNPSDRAFMVNQPKTIAAGIAEGIIDFLKGENLLTTE